MSGCMEERSRLARAGVQGKTFVLKPTLRRPADRLRYIALLHDHEEYVTGIGHSDQQSVRSKGVKLYKGALR